MSGFGQGKSESVYGPGGGSGGASGSAGYKGGGGGGGSYGNKEADRGAPKVRQSTPRGQMALGRDGKPAIQDLNPQMKAMFAPRMVPKPKTFMEPKNNDNYAIDVVAPAVEAFEKDAPPAPTFPIDIAEERLKRKGAKVAVSKEMNEEKAKDWHPQDNAKATANAYNTLFVGKLSYDTTEEILRTEASDSGHVKQVVVVKDAQEKSRGYAFIEFENEEDMTYAYKKMKEMKLNGRKIVADVERGRTVRDWKPMRLGGGAGGRPDKASVKDQKELRVKELAARKLAGDAPGGMYGPGGGGGGRGPPPRGGGGVDRRGGGGGGGYQIIDRGDRRGGDSERDDRRGGDRDRDRDRRGGDDRRRERSRSRDRGGYRR